MTESYVFHGESWFQLWTVNRPIVLGPTTTVKTRALVETVVWTVSIPNDSRYEGLPVVVFILLHRVFKLMKCD